MSAVIRVKLLIIYNFRKSLNFETAGDRVENFVASLLDRWRNG